MIKMSAAKETMENASSLLGEQEEQIDESKLSWLQRRKLNKQRKAEATRIATQKKQKEQEREEYLDLPEGKHASEASIEV